MRLRNCTLFVMCMLPTLISAATNFTLKDFADALDKDPSQTYKSLLESPQTRISTAPLGFTKEQELAFLFQLLPNTSQATLQQEFYQKFGTDPQHSLPKFKSVFTYLALIMESPNPNRQTLWLLAQHLPENTMEQKRRKDELIMAIRK